MKPEAAYAVHGWLKGADDTGIIFTLDPPLSGTPPPPLHSHIPGHSPYQAASQVLIYSRILQLVISKFLSYMHPQVGPKHSGEGKVYYVFIYREIRMPLVISFIRERGGIEAIQLSWFWPEESEDAFTLSWTP